MPRVEPTLLAAHIRRIAPDEALTDAELVGRYAEHRDAAAFEVLVWRHGPMVWATCRRILRHQQDVEDAFQATFLALTRTAGTLGSRQAIAGWLHRVAMNAAINLKARRRTTALTDDVPAPPEPDGELSGAVDEELERLPDRMRSAFVLCCLEGMTSAEAARELGCPIGTVDSRLHAARTRLRDRLTRRGLGPIAVLVGATWAAPSATATLPPPLVMLTLRHATHSLAAPNNINLLATGVLKAMSASKLKSVVALLFVGGALLIGGGIGLAHLTGQPEGDALNRPGTQKDAPMNAASDPVRLPDEWSKPVNGLQARVVLVEKPRSNGTRMLHPYLELRNTDNLAYPLKVRLGGAKHVKFELVDADGKVVDDGQKGARDGHYPDPGMISLPLDSSLRVGMFCTNWGVPQDAAAMIATDSGAWVFKPEQEGKVFLRATVSGKKDGDERVWVGELETKVKVAWSGEAPQHTDRPRQPGGVLGRELGAYLTIEGVKAEGVKIATNTLLVDTVNGKKLDKPVLIAVHLCDFNATRFDLETNHLMPLKVRCVYKGFESGGMIGVPPAVYSAAKELGRTDVPMSPAEWQWRSHFIALIEVKPEPKERK